MKLFQYGKSIEFRNNVHQHLHMKGSFQVKAMILCLKFNGTFETEIVLNVLANTVFINSRYFFLQRLANIHQ